MAGESCFTCKYYKEGAVFELCMHPKAEYKVAEKVDQHTVGHMRTRGECREAGLYYWRKTV